MAETVLARVSFFALMKEVAEPSRSVSALFVNDAKALKDTQKGFFKIVCDWFEMTDGAIARKLQDLRSNPGKNRLALLFHETAGSWVGGDVLKGKYPHLVGFATLESQVERLSIGFALSVAAADMAEKAGYPEDAAREHMLVMELCARYLKWIGTVDALKASGWQTASDEVEDLLGAGGLGSGIDTLRIWLGEVALRAAKKYEQLTWRSWRRRPYPEKCLVGQQINPEAVTMVCAIAGLVRQEQQDRLITFVTRWLGECVGEDRTPQGYLQHVMQVFRYPALNQLLSHKALIDSACIEIVQGKGNGRQPPYAAFEQMRSLYEKLSAPLHFTPAMLGESAALMVLAARRDDSLENDADRRMIRRAIEMLTASRETYSMGRAYYSSIAELNYLYDDYNDRRIHANHAAQMAGGELHAVLLKLMECAEV